MTTSTTTWPAGVKAGARVKFTNREAPIEIVGVVGKIDFDQEALIKDDPTGFSIYPREYTAEVVTPAPPVIPTEPGLYVERGQAASSVRGLLYRLDAAGRWTATLVSEGAKWVNYVGGAPTGADLVALKVAE